MGVFDHAAHDGMVEIGHCVRARETAVRRGAAGSPHLNEPRLMRRGSLECGHLLHLSGVAGATHGRLQRSKGPDGGF